MIESRCGISCSKLNCKEVHGFDCKGCATEESAPWGECTIKICCENKELSNCGECADFPCEILNKFSFDIEHGDDGARIKQCEEWTRKKDAS